MKQNWWIRTKKNERPASYSHCIRGPDPTELHRNGSRPLDFAAPAVRGSQSHVQTITITTATMLSSTCGGGGDSIRSSLFVSPGAASRSTFHHFLTPSRQRACGGPCSPRGTCQAQRCHRNSHGATAMTQERLRWKCEGLFVRVSFFSFFPRPRSRRCQSSQ